MTYAPIFCGACRVSVLCPTKDGKITHIPSTWLIDDPDAAIFHTFCSEECKEKGLPKQIRPPLEAHVDFERGGPRPSPDRQRGRLDALLGYDCAGYRPDYVKGYGEGMAIRPIIEAAQIELEKLSRDRGEPAAMTGGDNKAADPPVAAGAPPVSPKGGA